MASPVGLSMTRPLLRQPLAKQTLPERMAQLFTLLVFSVQILMMIMKMQLTNS